MANREIPPLLLVSQLNGVAYPVNSKLQAVIRVSQPWIVDVLVDDPDHAAWIKNKIDVELGQWR